MSCDANHDPRQASPLMWDLLLNLAAVMLLVLMFAGSC
jgi:hypothetical protein